ncbi:hypothetical protein ONZ45_g15976 [Pleurotus djamor]|nr:hypothetical protein ONZ45_g15976 [Pleurotus djamor]
MFSKSSYALNFILAAVLSISLLHLPTPATAVNMIGYPDTISCTDVSFECDGFSAGGCCGPFPPAFGFSVKFTGLPNAGQGNVFRDDGNFCTSLIASVFGPGDRCWNGGGFDRMNSVFWSTPGVFDKREDMECTPPNRFSFVDEKGVKARIMVPNGHADGVAEMFKKKDFAGLKRFQRANVTE